MNTAKIVWNAVKTEHKLQLALAELFLLLVVLFVTFFGKSIGLDKDKKALITTGLMVIVCLISYFVQEKGKPLYMFGCGFCSAAFLIVLAFLLGESW